MNNLLILAITQYTEQPNLTREKNYIFFKGECLKRIKGEGIYR